MIKFDTTKEQTALIKQIADRATKAAKQIDITINRMSLMMDLSACVAQGCPLDLEALLKADDFEFAHDVFGIQRHMDRDDNSPTGGQLLNHFLPRFARPSRKQAAAG